MRERQREGGREGVREGEREALSQTLNLNPYSSGQHSEGLGKRVRVEG